MTARGLLEVVGLDDAELTSAKIDGLRKLVLLYGAARSWLWLVYDAPMEPGLRAIAAIVLSVCAALAWWPSRAHWAPRIAAPVLLVQLFGTFPFADNHFMLEVLVVWVLAAVGPGGEGEDIALQGVLLVTAVVLFQTGLQKILYGQYFQGDFLAFMVGRGGRFGDAFAWILPPADVARLTEIDPMRSGAGPYRVASTPFIAVSNLVYLAELVLPFLLVFRRTRTVAALVSVVFVLALQLGAREIGFALLFSSLLLVFLPNDFGRKTVPFIGAFLAWVVLAAAGILPGGESIDPGWM